MATLQIRLLGEFKVVRDGQPLNLPPSKKTRALLAYLALGDRSFHRESLCELLWEIPDDPRGSLRWSLSKLRKLVDDAAVTRLIADRSSVRLDTRTIEIDCFQLISAHNGGFSGMSTAELLSLAQGCAGGFLEGLALERFHDFTLWCMSQREAVLNAQSALYSLLAERAPNSQGLSYARERVRIEPASVEAHLRLLQLLVAAKQNKEAQRHYQLAKRVLAEYGVDDQGLLARALNTPAAPAATPEIAQDTTDGTLAASPALAIEPLPAVADLPSRRLIGRDAEGEALYAHYLNTLRNSRARCVLLRGEPGIGKSFLMQVLVKVAKKGEAFLLHADAYESEVVRPFGLWSDAFRRSDVDSVPDILTGDSAITRDRLFAGLSDLLADKSSMQPLLIVFDDVQWCDESSASALHYTLRMNADRPIFAILAARTAELERNQAMQKALRGLRGEGLLEEMTLAPLPSQWLEQIIHQHNSSADAAVLARACHGNPLLAVELARAQKSDADPLRGNLQQLVNERTAHVDEYAKEVLYWAAVLDSHIHSALISRASGIELSRVEFALDLAVQHNLLVNTAEGLRFVHSLIGQSVYAQITSTRRCSMHRTVAQLFEQDCAGDVTLAADLAHHAEKSQDPSLATRAMVSAGKLCLRFFANDDAAHLARKGLDFARQLNGPERVCRSIELYDVLWQAAAVDDWQQAADTAVELAEQALDFGELHHARLGYHTASYLKWIHGQWNDARRDSLQAERVSRAAPRDEQVRGMAEAARCLLLLEKDISQADAMLMEAKSVARREQIYSAVLAQVDGMMCFYQGNFDGAEEYLQEARCSFKAKGDRLSEYQANEYLVMLHIENGHYDKASKQAEKLLAVGDKLKEGSEGAFARALLALCHYACDSDPSELVGPLQELRECDAKHRLSYTLIRAAALDLQTEQLDTAIERASEALGCSELLRRPSETMLAHALLAKAKSLCGKPYQNHLQSMHEVKRQEPTLACWAEKKSESLIRELEL